MKEEKGERPHRRRPSSRRRLPRLFGGEADEKGLKVAPEVISEGHAYDRAARGRGAVPYYAGERRGSDSLSAHMFAFASPPLINCRRYLFHDQQ